MPQPEFGGGSSNQTHDARQNRRRWLRMLAYYVVASAAALLSVQVLRRLGAGHDAQLAAAALCVVAGLLLVLINEEVKPTDSFAVLTTVMGLAAATVAALSFVGSIDPPPSRGCITGSDYNATVAAEIAIVSARATPVADPVDLALRGCRLKVVGYCIGAVHTNALERQILDSRWLILDDEAGIVAAGAVVGGIPTGSAPQPCPGSRSPPSSPRFEEASYDAKRGMLRLLARSERAAFIGFALRLRSGHWQRVGWDDTPADDEPLVRLALTEGIAVGDAVAAVACIGYHDPSGTPTQVSLGRGTIHHRSQPVAVAQPVGASPASVACESGILPASPGA
jgi:hypothetical protein